MVRYAKTYRMRAAPFVLAASAAVVAAGWITSAAADVKVLKIDKSGKASISKGAGKQRTGAGAGNAFSRDRTDPVNKFEAGELIVSNAPANFAEVAAGMGYRVVDSLRLNGLGSTVLRVEVPRGVSVPAGRRALSGRFPGAIVDANHYFEPQARTVRHARAAIGWKEASAQCGKHLRIGQIDTGVDITHQALRGQRVTFKSFHRHGRGPASKVHGTAVATMLVGRPKWGGLVPGAALRAASMYETKRDGSMVGSAIGLMRSLSWMATQRVHAVNLSIAGADNRLIRDSFAKARKKGLVLVAAAGNWGRADKPAYPAAYKQVMAITAVNSKKQPYSRASRGWYIDFAAPGVRIYTAVPGGAKRMSGSSFAAPYVTAMLAAQVATGVTPKIPTLRKALRRHTEDLGKIGRDDVFGYGFVKLRPRCK